MTTETVAAARNGGVEASLLHLLHLASPTLPIGTYAYSQGLEAAVCAGWLRTAEDVREWVIELMLHVQARVDLPCFARLYTAWCAHDLEAAACWSARLLAQRETRELQEEDRTLGVSLARLLRDLDVPHAGTLAASDATPLASAFALGCVHWRVPLEPAAGGLLYAWVDGQIAAATRLVPLGQTQAQRALLAALQRVPAALRTALALEDHEIGASAPGLGLLSAAHETQYTRLFRS